jgi:hypothetical protein
MERSQVLDASRRRRASGTIGQLKLYGSGGHARHRFEGCPTRGL